jgi:hypothetical protein
MNSKKHFNYFTLFKTITDELRENVNYTGSCVINLSNDVMKSRLANTIFDEPSYIPEVMMLQEEVIELNLYITRLNKICKFIEKLPEDQQQQYWDVKLPASETINNYLEIAEEALK